MNTHYSKQIGFIGLALMALLLVVSWGGSAHANNAAELHNSSSGQARVEAGLREAIQTEGSGTYLVVLKEQADLSAAYEIADWEARGWYVYNRLRETASRSQPDIINLLRRNPDVADFQSHFVVNAIYVTSGVATLDALAAHPGVDLIEAEKTFTIPGPVVENNILAPEWGVAIIRATEVWADYGILGDGVVVASIDTGVQHTHPALVDKYRGTATGSHDHNFFDPAGICSGGVCDNNGHGTHVTGTMVGDDGGANQIGVAPDAQWIAAKGCESNSCSDASLLASAEWMLAPCAFGDAPGAPSCDPAMRPHIINNSWGGPGGDAWYQSSVNAWRAAGMIPVFSAGNSGPGAGTIGSPSDYCNVMSIGGTNSSDGMYNFSSRGPGAFPGCTDKPDMSAPGQSVRSSVPTNSYATFSGTSMASPHVSGCIALMMSVAPMLDYDEIYDILTATAEDLGTPGFDYNYGHGRIDCYEAVSEAMSLVGDSTLTGQVVEASPLNAPGDPISGALVVAQNITTTRQALTDASGYYTMTLFAGTYDVTVSKFGFVMQTISDVEVSGSTVLNLSIAPADTYTVDGVVTDANTGWPLYAKITVDGVPGSPFWNDPVTGYYSLELPEGSPYAFAVEAFVNGYLAEERIVGPFNSDITEDFALDVDAVACVAPGYSLSYLYYENFQASNGGYTLSGTAPAPWQWGQPTAWPAACAEGTNCWGTNLTGNYNNSANETLTSPVIDLSGVTPGTALFARWYQANHIEHHQWDKAFAEVSINGGAWQVMWQNPPTPTVVEGWRELTYDVSAAAGTNAQFRWRFTSDSSVVFPGWYIDRVAIADDAGCAPAAGGLVVGNVYDDNTGSPLTGTLVANEAGTVATAMATADPDVDDAFYTIFSPAGSATLTATHTSQYSPAVANLSVANGTTQLYNFDLAAGWLVADPDEIEVMVQLGSSGSTTLDLNNLGDAAVNWEISARDEGFAPFATEQILVVRWDTANADAMQAALTSLGYTFLGVTDTVFRTIPVSELLEYEAVFYAGAAPVDSLPFLIAYLDAGGSLLIADNDLGFFRGTTVFYQQYLQATYNADDGGNLITGEDLMAGLDLGITADPWPDDFIVGAEGTRIFKYTTSNFAAGAAIERMDYRAVYLSFDVQHVAGAANRDEMINRILGFLVAGDVPWLTATPITGTLAALGSQPITLDFDATIAEVPEPGIYSALLRVANDTPYGRLEIPVTMNVTASPTLGLLAGVVQSQGYCDNDPFPAAGAEIIITSGANTWTRTADENGYYYIYLDESYSPVTVEASAPEHISETVTGVPLVGQQTTPQDFDLRWEKPCLSTAPDSFDVELDASSSATQTLTIDNNGGGVLNWAIHEAEMPEPAVPEAAQPLSFGRLDAAASNAAVDLVSLLGMPLPAGLTPVALPNSVVDCAAEPGIIIHDDGTIENGYSGNPAAGITEVRFVDRFTPANYPASFRAVCLAFLSLGPTSLNFDIVVYAADGPGGAPGTLLGSQAATAVTPVISPPIPPAYQPTWNSYDISAMGLQITSGSVYIGVRYTPLSPSNVFIAADESTGNPPGFAGGYWWNNNEGQWATIQSSFASYRSLMVRAVEALDGCSSPSDLSWVSVSPAAGATDADDSSEVVVTFDSTGLISGQTYSGLICLTSNDPVAPLVEIPVSLTVLASEDDGRIEGTVQSLGYCDNNPFPAEGAEVVVTSGANSWTLYANADGEYGLWLDAAYSPVDITVTAPNHTSGSATGVVIVAQGTTTVDFDLRLLEPCVSVAPAAFDVELGLGSMATYPLHISNNGALATAFELREQPVMGLSLFADLIQDGGFEAGTPNPFWDEFSTNFGTPLCDAASCGTGGGTAGPNTGAWWAWFGGIAAFEEGYVEQDVTIPVGTAELSFYFWIGTTGGPATDYFAVEMDGNEIFRVGADEQPSYSAYTLVALDVSDYADGGVHTVTFYGRTGGTTTTNFNLDDVVLESTAGSLDVLWLSTDPITGTVAADGMTTADVIFDTTVLTQTGVYNAFLRVLTDDPMSPAIDVPITLTVTDPEPAITLSVTVSLDNECGTADTLSVAPGSVVYYCYTVENTGNVLLPNHTITDTVFGHIATFIYDLMPGESESVVFAQTITADTTSTARWTASHAGLGWSTMAEDTVTVTLAIRYLYLPIIMKP